MLATNGSGTSEGPVEHFETTAVPIVTTSAAQSRHSHDRGPLGHSATRRRTSDLPLRLRDRGGLPAGRAQPLRRKARPPPQSPSVGSDFAVHAAGPATASELQPGTTYHYAIVATNSVGTVIGPDGQFTTAPPTPPLVSTGEASGVSQLSATLNGSVDTRELPTDRPVRIRHHPRRGLAGPGLDITRRGLHRESLTATFDGDLQPGTTYYYRTVATNADGTSYGEVRSFSTGAFPGQAAPPAVSLVAWPGFVLKELAAGIAPRLTVTAPKPLTKKQKLAKALKACARTQQGQAGELQAPGKRRYR